VIDPFPPDFLWGAATASYQVEGAVAEDGRAPSIWDTFCRVPGAISNGDTGDVAADHYHRWREDVALMADLGLRMYRFSIAWPRILPSGRGPVNERGLDFYRRLVDELLARGIEPNITLYHWDLPQALQDEGGWPARVTAERFAEYAAVVYGALHDRVEWWSTINEPWCVSLLSYAAGKHAPGIRDPRAAIRSIHHVLLAHGLGVAALRAIDPRRKLGIVLNLVPIRSATPDPDAETRRQMALVDAYRNRVWTEPLFHGRYPSDLAATVGAFGGLPVESDDLAAIAAPIEWLGINYYNDAFLAPGPGRIAGRPGVHPGAEHVHDAPPPGDRTDMGWPITPDGLRDLLVSIGRDHPTAPPLMIAENGAAYDDPIGPDGSIDDARRVHYLDLHVRSLRQAMLEGANVVGYLAWSLMDNFEWAEGYAKRFGIVHVDYATQQRTLRRSARWYRDLIATSAQMRTNAPG
jgi:beta-glucosidase